MTIKRINPVIEAQTYLYRLLVGQEIECACNWGTEAHFATIADVWFAGDTDENGAVVLLDVNGTHHYCYKDIYINILENTESTTNTAFHQNEFDLDPRREAEADR